MWATTKCTPGKIKDFALQAHDAKKNFLPASRKVPTARLVPCSQRQLSVAATVVFDVTVGFALLERVFVISMTKGDGMAGVPTAIVTDGAMCGVLWWNIHGPNDRSRAVDWSRG
jgi:hypothetical protein